MTEKPFVASKLFTIVMAVISLIMLLKSFIVAAGDSFESGISDLVIWSVMALTWVVALVLRLRSRPLH